MVSAKGPSASVDLYPDPRPTKASEGISSAITWFNRTWVSTSVGISLNSAPFKKVSKASSVGANTVKGPSPLNTFGKSPLAATSAATKLLRFGFEIAKSVIENKRTPFNASIASCGNNTLSMIWTIPLAVSTSAVITWASSPAASSKNTPPFVDTVKLSLCTVVIDWPSERSPDLTEAPATT